MGKVTSDRGQDVGGQCGKLFRGVPGQGRKGRAGVVEVLGRPGQGQQRERLGAGPELEGLMGTVDGFPGVLVCLLDAPHPQLGALHRGLVYPSQEVGVCLRTCVISSKQREAILLRSGKSRRVLGRAAGRREEETSIQRPWSPGVGRVD